MPHSGTMSAEDLRTAVSSLSTTVHVSDEAPGVVRLDLLSVPEDLRGRGCARDALAHITGWADATATVIVLTATYGLGADIQRLVLLYMGFGFVPQEITKLQEVRMRRDPRALVTATLLPGPPYAEASMSTPDEPAQQEHRTELKHPPRTCSA